MSEGKKGYLEAISQLLPVLEKLIFSDGFTMFVINGIGNTIRPYKYENLYSMSLAERKQAKLVIFRNCIKTI